MSKCHGVDLISMLALRVWLSYAKFDHTPFLFHFFSLFFIFVRALCRGWPVIAVCPFLNFSKCSLSTWGFFLVPPSVLGVNFSHHRLSNHLRRLWSDLSCFCFRKWCDVSAVVFLLYRRCLPLWFFDWVWKSRVSFPLLCWFLHFPFSFAPYELWPWECLPLTRWECHSPSSMRANWSCVLHGNSGFCCYH